MNALPSCFDQINAAAAGPRYGQATDRAEGITRLNWLSGTALQQELSFLKSSSPFPS